MKTEDVIPVDESAKDMKRDTALSETKSNYSDSSKLPDYIRFLCIYDKRVSKTVIMIGNLSSTNLDVDQIREDNQNNIDLAIQTKLKPNNIIRRQARLEGYEWAICLNEQKFLLIG